jgi:hypothetical protein
VDVIFIKDASEAPTPSQTMLGRQQRFEQHYIAVLVHPVIHPEKGTDLMEKKAFKEYLQGRDQNETQIVDAVKVVRRFETELEAGGKALESATLEDLREHLALLVFRKENSLDRLQALANYFYSTDRNDLYIYFTSIIGGRGVLPSMSERLESLVDEETRKRVFDGIETPPLGSPPEDAPHVTRRLMERLQKELPPEVYRKVLAGNHHRIPLEAFDGLKELYEESGSIDEFLRRRHERAIADLEKHLTKGKIWYEQEITQRVVDFVRGNREVLGGVRQGDRIYITKIPYDPDVFLREDDLVMKRYHACHCPFVRSSIIAEGPEVPSEWCYCSGGYTKLPFEVVFGEELEVELLESVLAGDPRCRFAVTCPEGKV